MEFKEIIDDRDIEILLSITATYPFAKDRQAPIRKQLLMELKETGDNRHIFIGIKDGMAVTMVQIVLKNADNDPDLANGRDVAHVHNLWVRYELQGNGIGRQMMAYIEEKARRLGKKILTLGVDDVNEHAIRLYEKLGYKIFKTVEGRIPEETCLVMKKSLSGSNSMS